MFVFRFFVLAFLAFSVSCFSGEPEPAPAPASAPAADNNALPVYSDPVAGYSFIVPSGYRKLTPEQNRQLFEGMSRYIGKDAAERAEKQPPACFSGPVDPKAPDRAPPALSIGFTELDAPVNPADIPEYKKQVEAEFKKAGEKYGEVKIEVVQVNGINALRMEHDIFSPIDNSRSRLINVSVPGHKRRYEIVFNYHPDQAESVEASLATVLQTFEIQKKPVVDEKTQSKWTRIAFWTIGCFVAGILLSLLLKVLAGVGEKEPEESGG